MKAAGNALSVSRLAFLLLAQAASAATRVDDGSASLSSTVTPAVPRNNSWTLAPLDLQWGACSGYRVGVDVMCANVVVPVCYESICSDTESQLELEVSRKTTISTAGAPSLWIVGDDRVSELGDIVNGVANVYHVQERRTLMAVDYSIPDPFWWRGLDAISTLVGVGNEAALSLTSSATDVAALIAGVQLQLGAHAGRVYVYGSQWDTTTVCRLMQFRDAQRFIRGYFLDSMVPSNLTARSDMFNRVADALLVQLAKEDHVQAKFGDGRGLRDAIVQLNDLYANTTGTRWDACKTALLGRNYTSEDTVQRVLSAIMARRDVNQLLPSLVYRLERCTIDDAVLATFLRRFSQFAPPDDNTESSGASLIWNIVCFSELGASVRTSRVPKQPFSVNTLTDKEELGRYCSYTRDNASYCRAILANAPESAPTSARTYQMDVYARNASAAVYLPANSSVVIWSSRNNPYYPLEYAKQFYDQIYGSRNKMLIKSFGPGGLQLSQLGPIPEIVNAQKLFVQHRSECIRDLLAPNAMKRDCGTSHVVRLFVQDQLPLLGIVDAPESCVFEPDDARGSH